MAFVIKIEPDARTDIQEGIEWYNKQKQGLGKQFLDEVKKYFNQLAKNPNYEVRYKNVHCLPMKRFPFVIHFTIDRPAKTIVVRAVFHTSLNPKKWQHR